MSNFLKEKLGDVIVIRCLADLAEGNLDEIHELLVKALVEVSDAKGIALDLRDQVIWDRYFLRNVAVVAASLRKDKKKLWAANVPKVSATLLAEAGMDSAITMIGSLESIVGGTPLTPPKVDVAFLNPFITGAMEAIKVQCFTEATPGKIIVKKPTDFFPVEIAAVLGIVSPVFNGSIAICFAKETFLNLMTKMLGEPCKEITKDLEDGAGELLNIIFGHAKRELNERGYGIEKAIPTIVRGKGIEVRHMTPSPTMLLPFSSDAGSFHIEIGLNKSN